MTPDRPDHTPDESEHGVLSGTGSIETAGFGILGGSTAQVNVELPSASDDDLVDDDVIGHEVPFVVEIPADTAEAEIVETAADAEDWTVEDGVEDWEPLEDIADADEVLDETDRDVAAAPAPVVPEPHPTAHLHLARQIMAGATQRAMPSVPVEPISTAEYPTAAVRPANCILSTTSLTRDYGIVPRPWQVALSEILDAMPGNA